MIIPISTQKLNIGDKVVTIKEIYSEYYIVLPGHEFNIIDYNKEYDQFICEDNEKLRIEISKSYITKKVSFHQAYREYIFTEETREYKSYIFKKCPNREDDYDDREIYDSCKLKYCYNNSCSPNLECSKYLTKTEINESAVLLKHLRRNKIKKLNKICLH